MTNKLLPIEPTDEMVESIRRSIAVDVNGETMATSRTLYMNLLDAAPPTDTVNIPKVKYDALVADAERYRMARTLGIAVVNSAGKVTGAHFNEGADQRVDQAIAKKGT